MPDPAHGLYVYPGRGGSGGRTEPRRPRPIAGAGAAQMPLEDDLREYVRLRQPSPAA